MDLDQVWTWLVSRGRVLANETSAMESPLNPKDLRFMLVSCLTERFGRRSSCSLYTLEGIVGSQYRIENEHAVERARSLSSLLTSVNTFTGLSGGETRRCAHAQPQPSSAR